MMESALVARLEEENSALRAAAAQHEIVLGRALRANERLRAYVAAVAKVHDAVKIFVEDYAEPPIGM